MIARNDVFTYKTSEAYSTSVAYFSMEFGIDQSLKIYSGGLGFLAGSHMRSAFELKQNMVGIGMLWKYGYYDQVRGIDGAMKPEYVQKYYSFLTDTQIVFPVEVHSAVVYVKAFLLKPDVFNTAPVFLLSTDIEQNDAISRTITNRLYDSNESTRIAQSIVLGIGGAKLLEILEMQPDIYHMNEGHALPLCFYLYAKYGNMQEVRKRVVFTTHTPEEAGNEQHDMSLLQKMSFFNGIPEEEVRSILSVDGQMLNYTLSALRFAKIANGVSQMHGEVARNMWAPFGDICEITAVTNAQNKAYWKDDELETAAGKNDAQAVLKRKKEMKKRLFEVIADQTGKIFDENILTIVWARRFAGYKRADLLALNDAKFQALLANADFPVQIIWAGKPYPEDYGAIDTFNHLFWKSLKHTNIAVLTGYELHLSALLKKGSDIWLNNPRLYREASGTSGMTAAMNGSVNFSIPDGWIPEFAIHGKNAFLIEPADRNLPIYDQDTIESDRLHEVLQNEIIPTYYNLPDRWAAIMMQAMKDVSPSFESGRMAKEYYTRLFSADVKILEEI